MQRYPMTPEQIDLVRKSFDALWPFRRKLAEQFYGRFFELAPDTRRLFPTDMERQQLKLMDTIAAIVGTMVTYALASRGREVIPAMRRHWRLGLAGGTLQLGSYGIAIWAMTVAPI